VAILSGGMNFYRMLVPYLAGAICIAILAIFMANVVVPKANLNLQTFKASNMSRWSPTTTNFHIRNSVCSFIYVDRWSVSENKGYMFSYDEMGEHFVKYRIVAREVQYDDSLKIWRLTDYTKRVTTHLGEQLFKGTTMDTIFYITPLDLTQDKKACEIMTYSDVIKYIREDKEKGGGMSKYYIIEAHKRVANSLGTIIMTLLGLSIATRKTRRGVGVHLFIGIALAFSFVFLQQISTVFSTEGGFSPALGTWIPNIIYSFICFFMIRTCQK
jgi:lipopolysaccharide export system permease protein